MRADEDEDDLDDEDYEDGCTFSPWRGASENALAAKITGGSENEGMKIDASCDANPFLWAMVFCGGCRPMPHLKNYPFSGICPLRARSLDFIMRKEERPKLMRKLNTVGEILLSDHKAKKLVVELRRNKWRKVSKKKIPRIQ